MVEEITNALNASTSNNFADSVFDSAILGLELNDPSYQITILPPSGSNFPTTPTPTRQLWTGEDVDDAEDPIKPAKPVILPGPIINPQPTAPVIPSTHPPGTTTLKLADRALPFSLSQRKVLASKSTPKSKATITTSAAVTDTSLTAQFTLQIHPDYHGAPPLPYISPSDGSVTYSSHDFIPTTTKYLFDLIFSLSFTPPSGTSTTDPNPLVSVTITIPTDTDPTVSNEPLLAGVYSGSGAFMLENHRLIPFLTEEPGSLTTTLTLRDALPDSSTTSSVVAADISDASFRLAQAPIAEVQNPIQVNVLGGAGSLKRGICAVQVTETYLLGDGSSGSVDNVWEIVKREGGDVDLGGNAV